MTVHTLKTWPDVFDAMARGVKTADFRKNDRDFKVGDQLELKEYDPDKSEFTGRRARVRVTDLREGLFGIPDGYCVMSVKLI